MASSSKTTNQDDAEYMNNINDTQINELKEQFHIYDINGSGYIEHDDMKAALLNINKSKAKDGVCQHITDNEITQLIKEVDYDNDGKLNFDEFIAWNRQCFINQMKVDFKDIDKDSSGYLTKSEIKAWLIKVKQDGTTDNYNDGNISIDETELDDLIYELDSDGNDRISVDEFIYGMAKLKAGDSYYVLNGEMYLSKLTTEFNEMDVDQNGYVTKQDLIEMANKLNYTLSKTELDSLLNDMDTDHDGKISLNEFIAASVSTKNYIIQIQWFEKCGGFVVARTIVCVCSCCPLYRGSTILDLEYKLLVHDKYAR